MAQVDPDKHQTEPDAGPPPKHTEPYQFVMDVKKKKKRRYTKGLRAVQQIERGLARSLDVFAEGVARTFSEYRKRSGKSARKKKDGALRDGIENWTKAIGKGISASSKAPYDFVKTVNSGRGSKQLRRTIRSLTPPPLR
jgi:Family of unknown function (DUF6312)